MRLTSKALDLVKGNLRIRNRLALDMNISARNLDRWISKNDDNLTKASALKVIREETGLTDEQILEEDNVDEPATAL